MLTELCNAILKGREVNGPRPPNGASRRAADRLFALNFFRSNGLPFDPQKFETAVRWLKELGR